MAPPADSIAIQVARLRQQQEDKASLCHDRGERLAKLETAVWYDHAPVIEDMKVLMNNATKIVVALIIASLVAGAGAFANLILTSRLMRVGVSSGVSNPPREGARPTIPPGYTITPEKVRPNPNANMEATP